MYVVKNTAASNEAYSILMEDYAGPYQSAAAIMGRIIPQGTAGRALPPSPHNGFQCEGTPLGKGHIMALQLGGPDISQNIVPQYEQWQQSGAWGKFEDEVKTQAGAKDSIFVVKLKYGAATDDYLSQKAQFASLEVFHWQDARIPTQFDIWCVNGTSPLAAEINANVLNKADHDGSHFVTMLNKVELTGKTKSFTQTAMPGEDFTYWRKNQVMAAAKECYMEYTNERSRNVEDMLDVLLANASVRLTKRKMTPVADVTRSPLREEPEYVSTYHDEIRSKLQTKYGWTSDATAAYLASDMIIAICGEPLQREVIARKAAQDEYRRQYEEYERQKAEYEKQYGIKYPVLGYKGYPT